MTVIESKPLTASGSEDSENNRSFTVVYQVITNDVNDGPRIVQAGTGLTLFSTYEFGNEFDDGAFFDRFSAARSQGEDQTGRKIWHVTAEFMSDPQRRTCNTAQIDNPVLLPPEISGSFIQFEKNIQRDADGEAIVARNGQPLFDITADDSRPSLIIKQNFATINLSQFVEFADALNSGAFFGLGKRIWKVQRIEWSKVFHGACSVYFPVIFEFHANFNTWDEDVANVGFFSSDGLNRNLVVDDNTLQGFPEPVPLDRFGNTLLPGLPLTYVTVRKYKEKNFNLLGIPTSL